MLPEGIEPAGFVSFLEDQRVGWWVNNTRYTKRSGDHLEALEGAIRDAGAKEEARCGSYRVWRVPTAGAR